MADGLAEAALLIGDGDAEAALVVLVESGLRDDAARAGAAAVLVSGGRK
jgi:hypothetical protein